MRLLFLLMFPWMLFGDVHSAKIEPLQIYHIKAAAAGEVLESDFAKESKRVENAVIVHIDDRVDRATLANLQAKKRSLEAVIAVTKESLDAAKQLVAIKKSNYEKIRPLKTKPQYEKNLRRAEYLTATQNYLSLKEKLHNLRMQLADIELQIFKTQDTIRKKNPRISGYVYKVYPRRGDFVGVGAPLVDVADVSMAKVTLYLTPQELEDIDKKRIYVDGRLVEKRFLILHKLTDPAYITQYKAELLLAPGNFGKLVKVEIK